jgi:hypothetical protein
MYPQYYLSDDDTKSCGNCAALDRDVIAERKGKDMGDTVLLAIYFPIIIGGMLGVIIWGMNAAGTRHGETDRTHSRTI